VLIAIWRTRMQMMLIGRPAFIYNRKEQQLYLQHEGTTTLSTTGRNNNFNDNMKEQQLYLQHEGTTTLFTT